MSSTYTGWKSGADFDCNMGYRRTTDSLSTFKSDEGTSNPLLEDAIDEEDTGAIGGAMNVFHGSKFDPIQFVSPGRMV